MMRYFEKGRGALIISLIDAPFILKMESIEPSHRFPANIKRLS